MESKKIKRSPVIESEDYYDKIKGCIFGHALGNAIGNPFKFISKKTIGRSLIDRDSFDFPLPNKYRFNHKKDSDNEWTDATDFLILTMQSLISNKKINCKDIAKRIKNWGSNGIQGIGREFRGTGGFIGTVSSREEYEKTPIKTASEFTNNSSGSMLRSPIISCMHKKLVPMLHDSKLLCILTHSDSRCVTSCLMLNTMIHNILFDKDYNLLNFRKLLDDSEDQREFDRYTVFDHISECELDGINWKGYFYNQTDNCFKALGAAIWTYKNLSRGFEEVIIDIALEGGDVDNNCAISGSLLGTFTGFKNLPPNWLKNLKNRDFLEKLADEFIEYIKKLNNESDGSTVKNITTISTELKECENGNCLIKDIQKNSKSNIKKIS